MNVQFITGDSLSVLKGMEDVSVNCCITSPPYFGLRDYGVKEQIGLESTPEEYIEKLVLVFNEVKRVLKPDGTLWLNIGDSYNGYMANHRGTGLETNRQSARKYIEPGAGLRTTSLKNKDMLGIPWRIAFALQKDGWYLRQDIIWHKPNPMPESISDRCTKSHEYLFLLSKSPRYYFDAESIKEPSVMQEHSKEMKNKRDVWTVPVKPFKGAHFATFPIELIKPCVLAGSKKDGIILDPFGGSGTTAIAAIREGRKAILIDCNPQYMSIAERRVFEELKKGEVK